MPGTVFIWLWLCALLSGAGWGLSALHQLNAPGYAVVLLLLAVAFWAWQKNNPLPVLPAWPKLKRRFQRGLPRAFLVLTAMVLLGGILYAPTNFDGLAYRLPRILHWLADDRWHWIRTMFPRVNGRACGIEWISAPQIALLKTDRFLFLINLISFLLMPGLIFSLFTRLGVRPRVAWHWMWMVPGGYGFLLQAGSIGNDLFGVPFVLAAMDFALRARRSGLPRELLASVLAAALMTGAKTSNLPLLLPWAVAIWPSLGIIRRSLLATVAVSLVALFASALPTLIFNAHYYNGDWAGLSAEGDHPKGLLALRTASNTTLLALQNLVPPVFPSAAWNEAVAHIIPAGLNLRLHQAVVEPGAAQFQLEQMQIEENAGLGFGVCLLLVISVWAAVRQSGALIDRNQFGTPIARWQTSLRWLPVISLLALLSQSVVLPIARIVVPYYPLLLPVFLAGPGQSWVVRQRWWREAAGVVFLLAGLLLVISPARPLFPAQTIISAWQDRHPDASGLERVARVYSVYRQRSDAFAPVLAELPPNLKILGVFTYDDPETALWRPFGSRRIVHVLPADTAEDLKREGVNYVVIPAGKLSRWFHVTPAEWVHSLNATILDKIPLTLRAAEGATDWWLVKLP